MGGAGLSERPHSGTPGGSPRPWSAGASRLPLWAGPWAGKGDRGAAAMSQPHNWFSLAEGVGWGRRLPRQIFSMTSKDIHVVRNGHAGPCRAVCAVPGVASWGPVVPGPVPPRTIALRAMAPIGSVPGHGHPFCGLSPGPTRLSCECALSGVTRDGIFSFGESRGLAARLCSAAGCIAHGWGTVLANLSSARFARQQQVLAGGCVPAQTTPGWLRCGPGFSGVLGQRVPVSLGIVCLGEEIPALGQRPGCFPAGTPRWDGTTAWPPASRRGGGCSPRLPLPFR